MGDWMMEISQGLQRRKDQKAWTVTATGSGRDQATDSSAQPPGGSSPVDTVQVCDIQNCKENVCKHMRAYVCTYIYMCICAYSCVHMCTCMQIHVIQA